MTLLKQSAAFFCSIAAFLLRALIEALQVIHRSYRDCGD
jgi:hypothetical protein